MTTSLQEIREKWNKQVEKTNDIGVAMFADSTADFWLSLIKERDAELVAEIKKYNCGEHKRLLALLTTTPTEGGEMK